MNEWELMAAKAKLAGLMVLAVVCTVVIVVSPT